MVEAKIASALNKIIQSSQFKKKVNLEEQQSGISGNVCANPQASATAPYPQLNPPWRKTIEEPLHMSTAEKSERPEQNQDLRCQSGPSAKDSVIFSGGDSSKNFGADQQRLQILDLHFDKFPTPATFACWKIRFKTVELKAEARQNPENQTGRKQRHTTSIP